MEVEKSVAIWSTLYNLHWDYIQTEENSTDLLLKKDKLKSCIQEFLSTTPPDRKFYLPQTVEVLRSSVQKLIHFAAYEASIAFDSIAQYANNLLTKPWRSEYKVIKTHSGFYQHKIKSQLIDVDKLFIAMGYVKSQNQTLLFDGPICQDQLANVSRDCMIACEECLIMHRLYYALLDNKVDVSWAEIFRFRESSLGDEHQSLLSMQHKKHKEKVVVPVPEHFINQVPVQRCNCTAVNTMHNPQYQPCQYNYQAIGNSECVNHHLPINHLNCFQPHYDHISHLPHSRSMDHYTDHVPISHGLFRHSLDHSITNDTVDGHQRYAKQFAPYNHTIYPQPATASNFYNNHLNHYDGNEYASIAASHRPTNANFPSNRISPRSYDQPAKYDDHPGMNYYPPSRNCEEDLIKFEDSQKTIAKADRNYGHSDLSYEYNNAQYTDQLRKADSQLNRPAQGFSYASALKQSQQFDNKPLHLEQKLREMELINGGLKPSKESRDVDKSLDRRELRSNEQRRIKNSQILAGYDIDDQNSRDSRASDFDSTDYAYDEDSAKASRNKDGQGSMEEWSYVYNGIKKNSQNNGNTFHDSRNGHDKANESKLKSVVKKVKEPKSDVSVSKTVMRDSKSKVNKLRPGNINIDEHEMHKNSTKKPQKNGRIGNRSPVTVVTTEWNCQHCTFINSGSTNICSMCSKSKNFEDRPSSKSAATSV